MICELCGKEHDGSYGSGRFCSQKCARSFSTSKNRKNINKKVSKKMLGRINGPKSEQAVNKWRKTFKINHWNKIKNENVKMWNGDILDITKEELIKYRRKQRVCEICGRPETGITYKGNKKENKPNNLTIDHNHNTKQFRGLLCKNCNSRLGWFENNQEIILNYLSKNNASEHVGMADNRDLKSRLS